MHTWGWYLRRYINETRAKGAKPVICSLIPRKRWVDGRIARASDSHAVWARTVARAEGVLLNSVQKDDRVRLLVRSGGATFEAGLEAFASGADAPHPPPIGSRPALTGVYEVQTDEYGRPDSFLLLIRNL